jgi:hypothetical protein
MSAKRTLRVLGAATILALTTSLLYANPVLPGGPMVPPDMFSPGNSTPLLYMTSGSFSFTSGSNVLNGNYVEVVFDDVFGVTCPTCLDFAFQVQNAPSSNVAIERVGMPVPLSISTDAGLLVTPGGVAPNFANRGSLGSTSFIFLPPLVFFGPGGASDGLVIATNATRFGPDQLGFDAEMPNAQIIGGIGAVTAGIVGPQASVPEPGTVSLLAGGLVGLAGSRLRRKGLL